MDYNKQIIELTLDMFLKHSKAEVAKNGADLTIDQLTAIAKKCRNVLQKEFALSKHMPEDKNSEVHYDEFENANIERIKPLLQAPEDGDETTYFCRKGLKGLFVAFDRMVGPEIIDQFRREAANKVNKLVNIQKLDEETIYEHEEVQSICDEFLLKILPHFQDFSHRIRWFRGVIEINLNESRELGDPMWQCREKEILLLTHVLYQPIIKKMQDNQGFLKNFDAGFIKQLQRFIHNLEEKSAVLA